MEPLERLALLCPSGQQWGPHFCSAAYGVTCFSGFFICHCCQLSMSAGLSPSSPPGPLPHAVHPQAPRLSTALNKASPFPSNCTKPCAIFLLKACPSLRSPLHGPRLPALLLSLLNPFPLQMTLSFFCNNTPVAAQGPSEVVLVLQSSRNWWGGLEVRMRGQRGWREPGQATWFSPPLL